ncbi:hypothetical protein COCSADRAFT_40467 [Bipolaris sorokiniana ND90Pr]|uniref:Uncharacterized protein n=1 Tax=Cochliobolus sativus (strain ND90Pr / ATCC 201652) TaxID=665912 RepID=M2QYA7_COCSN|nr:uncharacterized protein COCSADRAFT_40467 [Bipolaris sorokiniana ND90Pr]EMD60029.1 hypothetical protein COCSADRAFT_40467 [Bipolaris sorokiniana ND90Pr]
MVDGSDDERVGQVFRDYRGWKEQDMGMGGTRRTVPWWAPACRMQMQQGENGSIASAFCLCVCGIIVLWVFRETGMRAMIVENVPCRLNPEVYTSVAVIVFP